MLNVVSPCTSINLRVFVQGMWAFGILRFTSVMNYCTPNARVLSRSPKLDVSGVTSVHDWLDSIKMGQYSDLFSRAGFTQLSQFAEEEELDLSDMGIKLIGHKNKIRKSIKDVKRTLNKDNAL